MKSYQDKSKSELIKEIESLKKQVRDFSEFKDNNMQFKKIVDSTSAHMSFINKDYIYQEVNKSCCKANKKKREQIVGHSIAELLGSEVFENLIKEKIDRCFSGESVRYESWFDFAGIGRRYMDVSYHPYFDKEKQISGVIVWSIYFSFL